MAYKCNKPALKMLSPIFQKMGKNHCSEGPLSMGSPLSHVNTTGSTNHSHNGKKHPEGYVGKPDPVYKKGSGEILDIDPKHLKPKTMGMEGVMNVLGGTLSNIYTAGKFLFEGFSDSSGPRSMTNEHTKMIDEARNKKYREKIKNIKPLEIPSKSQTITNKNAMWEENVLPMRSPLSKTATSWTQSDRDNYREENPESNLKDPQPEGGARKKSYCARSAGIKKCQDPDENGDCPNDIARRKWKC